MNHSEREQIAARVFATHYTNITSKLWREAQELANHVLMQQGTWPLGCVQRAFVKGAAWWQFHNNGSTMFNSERVEAEAEAVRVYGEPLKEDVPCIWQYDDDGYWQAGCHAVSPEGAFCFEEGGPKGNHFRFCPFCGKPLEARIEAPADEVDTEEAEEEHEETH